jgi:hypothetical protein
MRSGFMVPLAFLATAQYTSSSWSGSIHDGPVEHLSNTRGDTGRPLHLVMAVLVAAIHVFGEASKVVVGRARSGHDVQKAPVVNTIFNRTEVGSTGPSLAARSWTGWRDQNPCHHRFFPPEVTHR